MSKSNIPEVIMWGVYAVITGVCLMGMTVAWSNGPGYGIGFGVVAAVLGTALIGVFAGGIHKLFQKYNPMAFLENRKLLEKIMEGLILLGILGGMIFVRLQYSWNITEQDVYELLQINTMDVEVVSGHGGHDLYLSLVRLSFLVLGNRAFAPIVLQLVLMVCATFSLYFGVRKLAGRAASIVAIGFLGFAPYMIAQTCNLTSFVLFLFFFGIALMCIGDIRHNMSQADSLAERLVALLCYVTTGLLIGVCCYLDVSGVILLLIATGIICSGENDTEELLGKPVIVFISIVVFAVFMFWLIHGSFESILKQLAHYAPGVFRIPVTVEGTGSFTEGVFVVAFLIFGTFSFWCQRCMGRRKVWLFAVILLAAMQCFGISAEEYFNGCALLYLLCLILAGCGLTDVFIRKPQLAEVVKEDFDMAIIDMDAPEKTSENQSAVQEIEYIENPLPLPKKHVKKVMDYDIEVSDDDDFDL